MLRLLLICMAVVVLAAPVSPAPALKLSATTVKQGGALEVTVTGALPGTPRVRFAGRTWPMYRAGDVWRTYVAADATTKSGRYSLNVEAGGRAIATRVITVGRVTFAIRRLRVPPGSFAPEKVAEERRKVGAALRVLAPQQLWEGAFILPTVAAPVSSPYGVLSIYNGVIRGFHRGTDFAAPVGTPVKAANHGIVRLADFLPLSGNAVLVDHGLGVISLYLHMSALNVNPGARLQKGDVLGYVGGTGVATGPHLHWGLRSSGTYVDPLPWTTNDAR
ncbi:MAG: M23 family metallopeptidase [bacterium]